MSMSIHCHCLVSQSKPLVNTRITSKTGDEVFHETVKQVLTEVVGIVAVAASKDGVHREYASHRTFCCGGASRILGRRGRVSRWQATGCQRWSTDEERARSMVEVCSARLGLEARLEELATVLDRDGKNTSLKGNIVECLIMERLVSLAQSVPDFSGLPYLLERPLPTSWAGVPFRATRVQNGPRASSKPGRVPRLGRCCRRRRLLPTRKAAWAPFSCSARNHEECVAPLRWAPPFYCGGRGRWQSARAGAFHGHVPCVRS